MFIFQKGRKIKPDDSDVGIDYSNTKTVLQTGNQRLLVNKHNPQTDKIQIRKLSGAYFKDRKVIIGETERRLKENTYQDGMRKNPLIAEIGMQNSTNEKQLLEAKIERLGVGVYSEALKIKYQQELKQLIEPADQKLVDIISEAEAERLKVFEELRKPKKGKIQKAEAEEEELPVMKVEVVTPKEVKQELPELEEVELKEGSYQDAFNVFGKYDDLPSVVKELAEDRLGVYVRGGGDNKSFPIKIGTIYRFFTLKENIEKIEKFGIKNLNKMITILDKTWEKVETGEQVNKVEVLKMIVNALGTNSTLERKKEFVVETINGFKSLTVKQGEDFIKKQKKKLVTSGNTRIKTPNVTPKKEKTKYIPFAP